MKDTNITCTINGMYNDKNEKVIMVSEKHLNGFIYDSLAFRYKDARYKQADAEMGDILYERCCDKREAKKIAYGRADRDFLRFLSILDEAIGEHD